MCWIEVKVSTIKNPFRLEYNLLMIYDFQRITSIRLIFWALLSLFAGGILLAFGDPFWRGFGLQAAAWGAVDAAIALFGLRGLNRKLSAPFDPVETARKTRWLRRVLAINAGLDILYITGGMVLAGTLGRTQPFHAGMGWGIVLQGAFLLAFDGLHAWRIPAEIFIPDWKLFEGSQHAAFERNTRRPGILLVHGFPDTPLMMSDLAEVLQGQGWSVSALLLPGFGPQLNTLFQQRVEFWVDAVCQEIVRLKKEHDPLLVVGFSLGGGLALPAAVRSQPDGLILLAPFSMPYPTLLSAAYLLARIFSPFSLRVRPFIDLETPEIQQGLARLIPEISLDDTAVRDAIRRLRLPFIFIEQFLRLARLTYSSAPQWQGPTLIIQGADDAVIRPSWTRRLHSRLGGRSELHTVPGNHNLNLAEHPAFPETTAEIAGFAKTFLRSSRA